MSEDKKIDAGVLEDLQAWKRVNILQHKPDIPKGSEERGAFFAAKIDSLVEAGGGEVVVRRPFQSGGKNYSTGQVFPVSEFVTPARLAAAGYLVTREHWDKEERFGFLSDYSRNVLEPLASLVARAERDVTAAEEQVKSLEAALKHAKDDLFTAKSRLEGHEKDLAAALSMAPEWSKKA